MTVRGVGGFSLFSPHFFSVHLYRFLNYTVGKWNLERQRFQFEIYIHILRSLFGKSSSWWLGLEIPCEQVWDRQRASWGRMGRERGRKKKKWCWWEKKRCKWLKEIWCEEKTNKGSKALEKAKKENLHYSQYCSHWVSHKALYLPLLWCYLTFKMVNHFYNICWFTKWRHCKLTWRQSGAASESSDFPLILNESYLLGLCVHVWQVGGGGV